MKAVNLSERELAHLRVLGILMALAFGLLVVSLWRMQVGHGMRYETSLESQSIRRVRIPGTRGRIFDRHGICLADNQPNYSIAIYLEELRRAGKRGRTASEAWKLVQRLSAAIGLEPEITKTQIEHHLYNKKPLPLLAWQHINKRALARFSEASLHLPAADIVVEPDRLYPWGSTACHLLGYVGKVKSAADETERYHYYLPDMNGKRGLEKRFDDLLAGKPGGRLVRVDVSGFKYEEIGRREPAPGTDLLLAIDLSIQRFAEQAIADTAGAVVVLDPRNGDVLAMASSPCFNLKEFCPSLSRGTWAQLVSDSRKPLLNRALAGQYPPGSVFKPIVAIAALEQGGSDAQTTFECLGYIEVGNQRFSCFRGTSHGRLGFPRALEFSCNVFFYRLGLKCGYDRIYQTAAAMGIGRKTGINMDYEASGLLPSREWKRMKTGDTWRSGDTCNVSIGQGALMVTPLQMAVMTSVIANGGYLYKPRLVIGRRKPGESEFQMAPPTLIRSLNWSPNTLALVKDGMRRVIQEPTGTGHLARVPHVTMAGKTGTAEYGKKSENRHHGWMILFAPFDDPQYAVAMVIDEAISGGASVGPRIRQLMINILAGQNAS